MSIVLSRSSSQYLKASTVNVDAKPVTIAAWFKGFDADNFQSVVCISNNSNEFLLSQLRGAVAGDPIAAAEYATAWKIAESSSGYALNVWTHVCCVFYSSADRRVYINGGGKVTNTDSQNVNFSLFDQVLVGTHKTSGGAHLDGKIAQVSIWSAELNDAEVVSLASGDNPTTIQYSGLVDYWPLAANGNNEISANTLVPYNSPLWDAGDNPPVDAVTATWPPDRPDAYNPDLYWDETDAEWNSDRLTQPGSYTEYVVAIGEEGEVYFRVV